MYRITSIQQRFIRLSHTPCLRSALSALSMTPIVCSGLRWRGQISSLLLLDPDWSEDA